MGEHGGAITRMAALELGLERGHASLSAINMSEKNHGTLASNAPHPPPVDAQLPGCAQWVSALFRWRGGQVDRSVRRQKTFEMAKQSLPRTFRIPCSFHFPGASYGQPRRYCQFHHRGAR